MSLLLGRPASCGKVESRDRSISRPAAERSQPVANHRPFCRAQCGEQVRRLYVGDTVEIVSSTAGSWVRAEVTEIVNSSAIYVNYQFQSMTMGKTIGLHSERLRIPANNDLGMPRHEIEHESSEEERNPGFDLAGMYKQAKQDSDGPAARQALRALEVLAEDGSVKACVELDNMAYSTESVLEALEVQERLQKQGLLKIPNPPHFLARHSTDRMIHLQKNQPTRWAIRFRDWKKFIDACKDPSSEAGQLYKEINNSKKKFERYVSVYDINEYFVIPWTRGKGAGVALLMEPDGLVAEVMISHAWGEDVEELMDALNQYFEKEKIPQDTPIWFCTFSMYQVEDSVGPSIDDQIKMNPFTCVINSKVVRALVAVHTSKADLYERLWCVRELDESLAVQPKVQVQAALSDQYKQDAKKLYRMAIDAHGKDEDAMKLAGLQVLTSAAKCRDEDRPVLLEEIFKRGGFERIDKAVTEFRRQQMRDVIASCLEDACRLQEILKLVEADDGPASDCLQAMLHKGTLKTLAEKGDQLALSALATLVARGKEGALDVLRSLYAGKGNLGALNELDTLAAEGNEGAIDTLRDFFHNGRLRTFAENCNQGNQGTLNALCTLAAQGDEGVLDTLRTLFDNGRLQTFAENCNQGALNALDTLAAKGDEGALDTLRTLCDKGKLQVLEEHGYLGALSSLTTLVAKHNREALNTLRNLVYKGTLNALAEKGSKVALSALTALAAKNNVESITTLRYLLRNGTLMNFAAQGNQGALNALYTFAAWGDEGAFDTFRTLSDSGGLQTFAEKGNQGALNALETLAAKGDEGALDTLRTLCDKGTLKALVERGNHGALSALTTLAAMGNGESLNTVRVLLHNGTLMNFAAQGNQGALNALYTFAVQGDEWALDTFRTLSDNGRLQTFVLKGNEGQCQGALNAFDILAAKGDEGALDQLRTLLWQGMLKSCAVRGYQGALNALATLAQRGNERALDELGVLSRNGTLKTLAEKGNQGALNVLDSFRSQLWSGCSYKRLRSNSWMTCDSVQDS